MGNACKCVEVEYKPHYANCGNCAFKNKDVAYSPCNCCYNQSEWKSSASLTATPITPSHYTRWAIDPLEFCLANKVDFVRGNIIKYIMRYDAKGGLEDLKKAQHYLEKLIKKEEQAHDDKG